MTNLLRSARNKASVFRSVIFIGGVAFSISHAIVPREEAELIKHLAEVSRAEMIERDGLAFFVDLFHLFVLGVDSLDHILYHRHPSSSKSNAEANR